MIFHNRSFQGDPFWDDMAKVYLTICNQFLKERFPKSKQTMESVIELTKVDLDTGKNNLEAYMKELEYGHKLRYLDGRGIHNALNRFNIYELRNMEAFKDHPKLKEDYLSEHSVDFMDLIDIFDK